ncbi:MAG: multidrug efflux MFS transporter [bacterium]|nr:multidrug efflux MFS transporter [bacterium]
MLGLDKKQFATVFTLMFATVVVVLNQTFLSPALPAIMADFRIESTTVQWLASGYALVEAVVIPMSAYLMGRFSTRGLYFGTLAIFLAGSVLAAITPNFGLLLVGRMLQATCTGALMPLAFTLTLLAFPRERRGTAMGIVGLLIGFAPAVGPSLSGLLVDAIGWRILFWIIAALAVLLLIIGAIWLPNQEGFERVHFDGPSVVLSSIGLASLLYGLSSFTSTSRPWISVAFIVVGTIIVLFYGRRQFKLENPMLRVDILKTRRYRVSVVVNVINQAALMGMGVIIPVYIQNILGLSALATGLIMLPGAILGGICGLISGRLFDKFGVRKVAIPGIIVVVLGAIGHIGFNMHASIPYVIFFYTFLGLGLQFTMPPVNTWGINSLHNTMIQHAQSVSNTLNQVANAFGTALLVSISALGPFVNPGGTPLEQLSSGTVLTMIVMTCIVTINMLIIIFLTKKKPGDVDLTDESQVRPVD